MEKNYNKFYTFLYNVCLVVVILFLTTPLGSVLEIPLIFHSAFLFFSSIMIVLVHSLIFGIKSNRLVIYLLVGLFTISYISANYLTSNSSSFYEITLFYLLCFYIARRKTNEKFNTTTLSVRIGCFLFVFFLLSIDVLPNYSETRPDSGLTRWSLGYNHPNSFGVVYLSLIVSIVQSFQHKDRRKFIINNAILLIPTMIFYRLTDSRTSIVLSIIILIVSAVVKYFNNNRIRGSLLGIFIVSIATLSILLSYFYPNNQLALDLNNLFSGRVAMGSYYIENIGVTLFGSTIPESASQYGLTNGYFLLKSLILDNSYIKILLSQGFLFFVLFIIFYFYKLFRNKYTFINQILIGAVFVLAAFEMPAFNVFLFPILMLDYVD